MFQMFIALSHFNVHVNNKLLVVVTIVAAVDGFPYAFLPNIHMLNKSIQNDFFMY